MNDFSRITFSCLLTIILLSATSVVTIAQDCNDTLDEAKALYEAGDFYPIPNLMAECLNSGFTEEQKVEAFEILTIIYNYNADLDSAESSYLSLLEADPIYLPDSNKQVEIEYISKRFKTDPVWTIHGPKLGFNSTFVRVINNNGTDNTDQSNEKYKSGVGGQLSGGLELALSKHFSLQAEVVLYGRSFNYTNTFFEGTDAININENQFGIDVPIFLKYQFPIKTKKITNEIDRWYPFFYAGYSLSYLFSDQSSVNYTSDINLIEGRILANGENLQLNRIRNNFLQSFLVGAGIKYRLRTNYIMLDIRYSFGLNNLVDPDRQFDFEPDQDPRNVDNSPIRAYSQSFSMVDDDFRLDNLFIGIGYIHPIYKPRKVDKQSIGDKIKNLFKKKDKDAAYY